MSQGSDRTRILTACAALMVVAALTAGWLLAAAPAPEQQPKPAAAPQATASDLPDFIPSERLPADSAVAFPVDI